MQVSFKPLVSLEKLMEKRIKALLKAVQEGVRSGGDALKQDLRQEILRAGLGMRLSKTWRGKYYKNEDLNAASLLYSKAPQIIRAFTENSRIHAKNAQWIAIPTKHAPKRGTNGRKIRPSNFPESRLGRLVFVERSERLALLIAQNLKATKSGFKKAGVRDLKNKSSLKSVVMFILVKETRPKKRLDPSRILRLNLKRLMRQLEKDS